MKTQVSITRPNCLKKLGAICFILFLFFSFNSLQAQTSKRAISGVVKSVDGPLPGATVLLQGTLIGTHTDENGKFTFPLQLKTNDVLVYSALGYDDTTVIITGETTFVESFLPDNPIVIVAALRTTPSQKTKIKDKD